MYNQGGPTGVPILTGGLLCIFMACIAMSCGRNGILSLIVQVTILSMLLDLLTFEL